MKKILILLFVVISLPALAQPTNRASFPRLIYIDTASCSGTDVVYNGIINFDDDKLVEGYLLWSFDTISVTSDAVSLQREVYVSTDGKEYHPVTGYRDTCTFIGANIDYEDRYMRITEAPFRYLKAVLTLIDSTFTGEARVDGQFTTRKP